MPPVGEGLATRVDGDIERLLPRECSGRRADRCEIVGGEVVDVHGRPGEALHLVLVLGAEQEWIDPRSLRLTRHRDADVRGGRVQVRYVQLLRAVLLHHGLVGRVAERRGGIAVGLDAVGAHAGVATLHALQRDRGLGRQRGTLDDEHVRDPPRHVAAAQDEEAVLLAGRRRRSGARDDGELGLPAGGDVDRSRHVERRACGRGLRRQLDLPASAAAVGVDQADKGRAAGRAAGRVEVAEGERDGIGEELRVGRAREVREAAALEQHRGFPRPRRVPPGGPGGRDERGLHLPRRPRVVELDEQGGRSGDVRRRHGRAVEHGEARLRGLRQRRREDLPAGRGDVRLERVPERRRAAGREAGDHAAAAVHVLERLAADAERGASAARGHEAPQQVAVRVRDRSGRQLELYRDLVRLTLPVVGEDQADGPGGARLGRLPDERADAALRERDRAVERVRG